MKGSVNLIFILLLNSAIAGGQAEIRDYLQVIVEFTENNQNLEAIKLCNKLEKSYPENPDVYYLRGINRYLLKDYEEAVKDFDKTLNLNPEYSDAYLYRAKARKAGKDYFGAFKDYNKAKDENFTNTVTSLAGDVIRSIFSGKNE